MLVALLEDSGREFYALLTRLTLREDVAEDLMQELFLRLSRSREFSRADSRTAYARRAAIHLAFDWRRARKRQPTTEQISPALAARDASPLSRLIRDEQFDQILDAASKLSRVGREAFVMRYIQQEPYEAIAEQLGRTPHQVRALCHKAVKQIRSLVNRELPQKPREQVPHERD